MYMVLHFMKYRHHVLVFLSDTYLTCPSKDDYGNFATKSIPRKLDLCGFEVERNLYGFYSDAGGFSISVFWFLYSLNYFLL